MVNGPTSDFANVHKNVKKTEKSWEFYKLKEKSCQSCVMVNGPTSDFANLQIVKLVHLQLQAYI